MNYQRNALVYLVNGTGWGDHFLALPFLRKLRDVVKPHEITVVALRQHVDVLFADIHFKWVPISLDRCKRTVGFDPARVLREHSQVLSFNGLSPDDFDFVALSSSDRIDYTGFYGVDRNPIYPPRVAQLHIRDQYFALAGLPIEYSLRDRQICLSSEVDAQIARAIGLIRLDMGDRFFCLHLDSDKTKRWDLARWSKLVKYVRQRWRAWCLLVGNGSPCARSLLERHSHVKCLTEFRSIAYAFAAVKQSPAFVGIDSIMAHVADSYGHPMVVLFGPFPTRLWGPIGREATVVDAGEGRPVAEISFDRVAAAVDCMFETM